MTLKAVSGIMLTLLLMGLLMLAFNVHLAESLQPPATEWSKTYGGTSIDVAYSIIQTSDGGYALAGSTLSCGGSDFWSVKTDSAGNMQ